MIRKLVPVEVVSELTGLSPKTIYAGKAGTSKLTKVKQGSTVRFILQEVEAHIDRAINASRR